MADKPGSPKKTVSPQLTEEELTRRKLEASELRKRIERLEERLDASIAGDDGLAELDKGIDKSPSGNPLERAVRRSNIKRGSRKA